MEFEKFHKLISKIENLELPGEVSQIKMSPPYRLELMKLNKEVIKKAKTAGVLMLLYPDENDITRLILILRKAYNGVHSAQVGLPGGKLEAKDVSIEHAALRETFEEVGVPIDDVKVIKTMTQLYIPPSNFAVHPFLAITTKTPNFVKQVDEVEDLIEVGLSHIMDDQSVITTSVPTSYEVNVEVPAFQLKGHMVWGATAMMLSELKDLLKQVL